MHWTDVVAEALLKGGREHTIASGTSISGLIHIGNAGDVVYADGIARALHERGAKAKVVWVADDVDPLRAVPEQLPMSFAQYLGKPVAVLPDPDGCHPHFTDHFIEPFLRQLRDLGIRPVEKRGSRMYAAGEYDQAVRVAIEHAAQIREILRRVSGSKKTEEWLPFDPICDSCGRIATTDAVGIDGERVRYRCGGGVAGKKEMLGCGYEGATSIRLGKLTWRVEWAARWKILGVTCEPFGKEHSAAGGSYDTSKVIVREVYEYPPPEPVLYEHILVGGEKMSKSKGNVFSLDDLLKVAPPEVVRYFYFRVEPNKHKDFEPRKSLLPLIEEYERTQRIALGREEPTKAEDAEHKRRSFGLAQVRPGRSVDYGDIPFAHLITVAHMSQNFAEAIAILRRSQKGLPSEGPAASELERRYELTRRYILRWVPEADRIRVRMSLEEVPLDRLPKEWRAYLGLLAKSLESVPWDPEPIHNAIFDTARAAGLEGRDAFKAVYLALIGTERGPRAGYFVSTLEREFVVERFQDVASAAS